MRKKIQFLYKDISLNTLRDDYLVGSIEKEYLEKIIIDNKDADFFRKLEKQLRQILCNPVGRAIIRCIIECETDEKIVFVPIAGFLDKKTQTPPALSVIDGTKCITITVPTNMKIGPTSLIGVTRAKLPTIITSLPFHSVLAHELIHCIHRMYEKMLYSNSKAKSNSVPSVFAQLARIDKRMIDFDMSEELYTVLGVRAVDNKTQDEIYRKGQYGDSDDKSTAKLTACGISEIMYDAFDKRIDCMRVLYYNKNSSDDISKFMNINKIVSAVLSLLDEEVRGLAEKVIYSGSWRCGDEKF